MRHGTGKMAYEDGSIYEGDWRKDKREGQGTFTWNKDKAVYKGEFKDDCITGKGEMVWEKSKYEGNFAGGMKNGKGTMSYADNSVYEGNWVDD